MTAEEKALSTMPYRDLLNIHPEQILPQHPAWLRTIRELAWQRFQTVGFPTRKTEAWKYVDLEAVFDMPFGASHEKKNGIELPFARKPEEHRAVLLDGKFVKEFSAVPEPPVNLTLDELTKQTAHNKEISRRFEAAVTGETNPFALANIASFESGFLFRIPKNTILKTPVRILSVKTQPGASNMPLLVFVEDGAHATIFFDYISHAAENTFCNLTVYIFLGRDATLRWFQSGQLTKKTLSFQTMRCFLGSEARFEATCVCGGGALTRHDTEIHLTEERASSELKSLTVLDGKSEAFHHVTIRHGAPHCKSTQLFKTILAGQAKSETSSMVHVEATGQKSDSRQLIRNLLLSEQARVYARPRLQIETDDVKATHGAATGKLEKAELFYLRSRGLSEKFARFVLTYGFAQELLDAMPLGTIQTIIAEKIKTMLNGNASA